MQKDKTVLAQGVSSITWKICNVEFSKNDWPMKNEIYAGGI